MSDGLPLVGDHRRSDNLAGNVWEVVDFPPVGRLDEGAISIRPCGVSKNLGAGNYREKSH